MYASLDKRPGALPRTSQATLKGVPWDKELALEFDGATTYVDLDNTAPSLAAIGYTTSFWIQRNGTPTVLEMLLAGNDSLGGNVLLCRLSGPAQNYVDFVSDVFLVTGTQHQTTNVCDNAWHHIMYSVSLTGILTMYVDGLLEFTGDGVQPAMLITATDSYQFGMEFDGAVKGDFYGGEAMQVALWDSDKTALLPTLAPYLYNNGAPIDPMLCDDKPTHFFMLGDRELLWTTDANNRGTSDVLADYTNFASADLTDTGL